MIAIARPTVVDPAEASTAAHLIAIERIGSGNRGDRWRVFHDGAVLVPSTRDPTFDACRFLAGRGAIGRLEVWHVGQAHAAVRLDIERGASLTVMEGEKCGPRIVPWKPFVESAHGNAIASVRSGQGAATETTPLLP